MRRALLLAGLLVGCASASSAQGFGTLSGKVLDAQGGALPGSEVRLQSSATGESRTATASPQGEYRFLRIAPGPYLLSAEMQGFKKYERTLTVQVNDNLEVNLPLELGPISDTVVVTAESPLLRTNDAQQGEVITGEMIQDLPQLNRDPLALAVLAGNVQGGDTSRSNTNNRAGEDSDLRINGGRAAGVEYMIDGISAGTGLAHNIAEGVPTMEGVAEFKVITNGLAAEYGRLSGGAVELVTSSGTNAFHGQAFEYFQDDVLNANSWNQNRLEGKKPDFKQNQFGFALGGPIVKNKTFFYANYEGLRYKQKGALQTANVPTELERRGDFTQTVYQGATTKLFDPKGAISPEGERLTLLGGDGMHVPADRISPVSAAILSFVPLPNRAPASSGTYVENYAGPEDVERTQDTFALRLDHVFNNSHRIFARYSYLENDYATSRWLGPGQAIPHNVVPGAWNLTLNYDWTLSESTLLNVRTGGYYSPYTAGNAVGDEYSNDKIPWDSVTAGILGPATSPWVKATQYTDFLQNASVNESASTTFTAAAALTKILGRHALKFGYEHRRYYDNYTSSGSGNFVFQQNPVFQYARDDSWNPQDGANVMGAFLLGVNDLANVQAPRTRAMNFNYHALFAQDEWKVNDKLTVGYGLRWDLETPVTERNDKLYAWDPNAPAPFTLKPGYDWNRALANATLGDGSPANVSPSQVRTPAWVSQGFPQGAIRIGNTPEHPSRHLNGYDWDAVAPRLMATYRVGEKTVLRASAGKIFGSITGERSAFSTGGSSVALSDSADAGWHANDGTGFRNLISNWEQPFRSQDVRTYTRDTAAANQQVTGGDPPAAAFNSEVTRPYEYAVAFGVQHELAKNLVVEASYNGNFGRDLIVNDNISRFPKDLFVPGNEALYRDLFVESPTAEATKYGDKSRLAILEYQYPYFGPVALMGSNEGRSNYNALNLRLQRRGITFNFVANYTLSRLEDNVGSPNMYDGNVLPAAGQRPYQQVDPVSENYGLSPWDETHRLVVSYSVALPFGKGRKWLSNASGGAKVLELLFGGWDLAGYSFFRSGRPVVIAASNINNDVRVETTFARLTGGGLANGGFGGNSSVFVSPDDPLPPASARRFDSSAVAFPAVFTYGDLSVYGDIRQPHRIRHDMSLMKRFELGGSRYLQLRIEAFNVFNQRGWADYNTDPRSEQFGLIRVGGDGGSNLYLTERQVQLSGRFVF